MTKKIPIEKKRTTIETEYLIANEKYKRKQKRRFKKDLDRVAFEIGYWCGVDWMREVR